MTSPSPPSLAQLPWRARAVDVSFWLLSRLPLRLLHALGAALGELAWRLPGRYGQRLDAHLAHAFPGASAQRSAREAGRMMIEMPFWWKRTDADLVTRLCHVDDWSALDRAYAEGRGVILLTPHFGGFEALAVLIASRYPLTALFRPPHAAWLRVWIERVRLRPNLRTAPADVRGVRALVKALRNGETVGILPDQVPSAGEGVWAPFFGKPAYTMSLAHRLHHLSGAPIVVLGNERLPGSRGYRLHAVRLPALPGSAEEGMTRVNRALEELIAVAPEQYLWSYNRYKNPGVPGPESGRPSLSEEHSPC